MINCSAVGFVGCLCATYQWLAQHSFLFKTMTELQKYASQHTECDMDKMMQQQKHVIFDGCETLISENKADEMTQVTTERESK